MALKLAGLVLRTLGHGLEYVTAGEVIEVKFRFRCHLLPRTYFVNAGCSGKINGVDSFIHRIVDAAIFRVFPTSHLEMRAG